MGLCRLFSYNVEIQYKSYLLSKATFLTVITTLLTLILPFIVAYRSRGFWLKSASYFEQPTVSPSFDYILIAETGDPTRPIVCVNEAKYDENYEFCDVTKITQLDINDDKKNDVISFHFHMDLAPTTNIIAFTLILGFDFQLQTVCPLQMQSLGIIQKDFTAPVSHIKIFGDLDFQQTKHLSCIKYHIDTKYNQTLFDIISFDDFITNIFSNYFNREVTSQVTARHTRLHYGRTNAFEVLIDLRINEVEIYYTPSFMQELKWAWPQYLSLVIIFYWIFGKIKKFVFTNRLVMAWEVTPWKKCKWFLHLLIID